MTRAVWAVDVTAAMVSLARVTEGDPKPRTGMVETVTPTRAHSARTTWHRATTTADKVLEKITANGTPTMVVLAKQRWSDMKTDASAQRRLQLYTLIEERLHRAGIPVAEFPYVTALAWMSGFTPRNAKGTAVMTQLAAAVTTEWGIERPTYGTNGGETKHYPIRIETAALTAVVAMALGIETSVPVTVHRLEVIGGVRNQAVQWPGNLALPKSINGWEKRKANPSACWRSGDEEDD
jgi:hypothetical protein